jgi:DNA-binding winged helix-turn-helix (wHTH) protein
MKTPATALTFPPFRLDSDNACLWRGTKRLVLPPKDFAVLYYLATHAGQLVTHTELLKAVWPDTIVSPKGLKAFVRRLRQQLGDNAAKPRFIETVHGRGYRFLPAVTTTPPVVSKNTRIRTASQIVTDRWQLTTHLVGRETELKQLHKWLDKATGGHRQIVFVTGEPGIGKTALIKAFLEGVRSWELGSGTSPPRN